jgi:2-polyprenyl-3-methyl-5-hydroxy-6-metoxy-1,4-benzoquinol methylase
VEKNEYRTMFQLENEYWWYKALHELVEHYVAGYADAPGIKILDGGCGTGRLMEILSRYGHVEGLDYSDDAVQFAKKRGLAHIRKQDLTEWDSGKQYDVITSIDVIYCISDDELVLKNFYKALKPGGKLILNLPAFDILRRHHDEIVHTKHRYTIRSIRRKLEKAGFKIEKATYRLPFLFFVILMIKLIEIFVKPKTVVSDLKPVPGAVNSMMLAVNRLENFFIKAGLYIPFGSSVFIIAGRE